MTRALWICQILGGLMAGGFVRVAGYDQDEVDELAAVSFEPLGKRRGAILPIPPAGPTSDPQAW